MAFHTLETSFCGPPGDITHTLSPEDAEQCQQEAGQYDGKISHHFLFSPDCCESEPARSCPQLSALFRSFTPPSHSLVFAPEDASEFPAFVGDLIHKRQQTYRELLLRHSVRVIPATETEYQLSGGSFSGVFLSLMNEQRWRISKMMYRGFGDQDGDIRLLEEARFICGLPPDVVDFFPAVDPKDVIERPDQVGYHMQYHPFPTMAELVLSQQITPEQTVTHLAGIYDAMLSRVYCKDKDPSDGGDDYFSRIDRRMERVLSTPEGVGPRLKRLLLAERLSIDGRAYEGFFPLYRTIRETPDYRNLATPPDHCLCHGDMILEDILLHPYRSEFKLIDPNGRSNSKYYDVAKTLLSLATKYELFYFDDFLLEFNANDETDVHINFQDPGMVQTYDEMHDRFWEYLKREAPHLFPDDPSWRQRLLLLNGLQNIAIVMFHLIRHHKEDRATAFLLMGIKQVTAFLETQKGGMREEHDARP
ncbi:MAG: hypothetical protein PHS73_00180 [Candidatus Peribacteraceae bacterium]|nr:hypothetical protein [Candidatus Peribacteraceae bacterium]